MFKKRGQKKGTKENDLYSVLAALGVMEDEFCGAAPMDEIHFCLRVDFKRKMKDTQMITFLEKGIELGYSLRADKGWKLTPQGAQIVDEYLSSLAN
ncbi:hypothetical protein NEF87_004033 [Candidatus Lokiarchaeum ossiferum]|uniref:ArnR1-like winged helix-turn-helix domain-containing protein n=1 Tax=Candidatus Lokiarchaeum ossiferum TaxID=2951803 RepID=A0ABY6HWL5_9ARCH|nr:hypothetical protein NEF87_004033 [Candidatus Lokiarchaeum sp. B-35]